MVGDDLNVDSVGNDLSVLLELVVLGLGVLSKAELDAGSNLLSAGVLEHRSSEGLLGMLNVVGVASDRHKNCSDIDSG